MRNVHAAFHELLRRSSTRLRGPDCSPQRFRFLVSSWRQFVCAGGIGDPSRLPIEKRESKAAFMYGAQLCRSALQGSDRTVARDVACVSIHPPNALPGKRHHGNPANILDVSMKTHASCSLLVCWTATPPPVKCIERAEASRQLHWSGDRDPGNRLWKRKFRFTRVRIKNRTSRVR